MSVRALTLRATVGTAASADTGSTSPDAHQLVGPLHPGLRPQGHSHDTIRLGEDPVHGAVLGGLEVAEVRAVSRLLDLLAGAAAPLRVTTLASACGLPVARVRQIVRALEDAGLTGARPDALAGDCGLSAWTLARLRAGDEQPLHDRSASTVAQRRSGARVVIDGRGPLTGLLARLLGAAGVDRIRMGWYASAGEDHDRDSPDPTLVISVGTRLPFARSRDWWERGVVHLPVLAHAASADIGPLLVPGAGPCLTCVHLGLPGSDPRLTSASWNLLGDAQHELVQAEPSLAGLVSGTVAMLALGVIDAHPPPVGIRWHTALPLPSLATSRHEVHPHCDLAGHRPVNAAPDGPGATMT
ncbi:MAG: helix-turn-helix domain-containing protein [Actinomycetales bacterium]|nr:helix-turn-helix domain-containing protein [Tetrasphaera sp.]NLX00118.1 helix-turn-helix domain-containing protein [Actinomycetales bacterium]